MNEWTQEEQQSVATVIVRGWPGGVRNQGWDLAEHLEVLEGFLSEMQELNLTAHWAIVGLRESGSAFLPSATQVRALARAAMPPLTAGDIQDIADRQARERRGITKLIEPGPPGEEMCCSVCGQWSPSSDFDQVSDDELECPECGYANGPPDVPLMRRMGGARQFAAVRRKGSS